MSVLSKQKYMFNGIPMKIPMTFIAEIEKSNLKFIWNYRRPAISKGILSTKSNTGGITIPNFRLYYRSIAIKTACNWLKNTFEVVEKNKRPSYESTR
jgi:hypothetical protein